MKLTTCFAQQTAAFRLLIIQLQQGFTQDLKGTDALVRVVSTRDLSCFYFLVHLKSRFKRHHLSHGQIL